MARSHTKKKFMKLGWYAGEWTKELYIYVNDTKKRKNYHKKCSLLSFLSQCAIEMDIEGNWSENKKERKEQSVKNWKGFFATTTCFVSVVEVKTRKYIKTASETTCFIRIKKMSTILKIKKNISTTKFANLSYFSTKKYIYTCQLKNHFQNISTLIII